MAADARVIVCFIGALLKVREAGLRDPRSGPGDTASERSTQNEKLLQSFGSQVRCANVHFRSNGDYCPYSGLEPFETAEEEASPAL